MVSKINTSDAKWQVSPEFQPDKDDTWKYPTEKDGWVLAHNMIRGEVNDIIKAVESNVSRGTPAPAWVVESIAQVWTHHQDVVHDHHRNEDDIMNPFMKTRINFPEKLEADHVIVIEKMNDVTECVKALKEGDSLNDLLEKLNAYKTILFPHLLEEEEIALPLLRSYFTPAEVGPVIGEILKVSGRAEIGSFVSSMGEEYFRSTFMKQEGIPFFVWYLKFKGDFNYFEHNIKSTLEALDTGVPGTTEGKGGAWLC